MKTFKPPDHVSSGGKGHMIRRFLLQIGSKVSGYNRDYFNRISLVVDEGYGLFPTLAPTLDRVILIKFLYIVLLFGVWVINEIYYLSKRERGRKEYVLQLE